MNPYDTLGVAPDATADEIKAAHRRAARQTHPDAPEGDPETFHAIQTAFEILSDEAKRKLYDETGATDPGQIETALLNGARDIIASMLIAIADSPDDLATTDVHAKALRAFNIDREKHVAALSKFRRRLERLEALRPRVTMPDPKEQTDPESINEAARAAGVMTQAFAMPIADMRQKVRESEQNVALFDKAIEIWESGSYEFDASRGQMQPVMWQQMGHTGTTWV